MHPQKETQMQNKTQQNKTKKRKSQKKKKGCLEIKSILAKIILVNELEEKFQKIF